MRNLQKGPDSTHQSVNVMEELVHEEITRQMRGMNSSQRAGINSVEVATYALNRLLPLYASSYKGKAQQLLLGRKQYRQQITVAVRQGIAAVGRDPLRVSQPLVSDTQQEYQQAQAALRDLERLLEDRKLKDYEELSWHNLVPCVQKALNKAIWTGSETSSLAYVKE